jgi:nitrite reductase/ring-hydroxylating ferredoxin subunit
VEWIETVSEDELAKDERKVLRVGGYSVLLFRHEDQIYAIESACPHMRLPLKGGKVHDHTITCPWHRSAFDLDSGDVKDWSPWPPAVGRMLGALSREKALHVFPTKVEQGKIWVQFGQE